VYKAVSPFKAQWLFYTPLALRVENLQFTHSVLHKHFKLFLQTTVTTLLNTQLVSIMKRQFVSFRHKAEFLNII
jgi:hypothetical protein